MLTPISHIVINLTAGFLGVLALYAILRGDTLAGAVCSTAVGAMYGLTLSAQDRHRR